MITQVKSWGNSQGIRLSKDLLALAEIKNNDYLAVYVEDGKIILEKQHKHRTLEERAKEFMGKVGPYSEYNQGNTSGRERW